MARQRHWVNRSVGGDCVFLTTTVLDFVLAFERYQVRTAMAQAILRECKRSRVTLHAFVVMPHHIQMVAGMPPDLPASAFMRNFKPRCSGAVRPLLTAVERAQFSDQRGLNRHVFWQRSYRGKMIQSPRMFAACLIYVFLPPGAPSFQPLPPQTATRRLNPQSRVLVP